MDIKKSSTEIFIILLASIVLAVSVSFNNISQAYIAGISFVIILSHPRDTIRFSSMA